MAAVEKTRQRGRKCGERERETKGKDERAWATHRVGGVRQRQLRATCPISPIYANRHPRGWLLTVSSFRALRFFPACVCRPPRFTPLLIPCRYTCANDDAASRRPKAANRKTQRHCLSRCERRADTNVPSVSPILFAIVWKENASIASCVWFELDSSYLAKVHQISVRQYP